MTASFKTFLKTYLAIGAVICVLAIVQTEVQTEAILKFRTRYKWVLLMGLFAVNAAIGLYLVLRPDGGRNLWERIQVRLPRAVAIIAAAVMLVLPFPILWDARSAFFGEGLQAFFRLLWLFWWLLLLQVIGLRLATSLSWAKAFACALVLDGAVAEIYVLLLPVTDYPFSVGWSEASRFYYGSLLFSRSIYGAQVPLSIWHGTRYILLSIPFLMPGLPLWGARLWQVLLWLGITLASSWLLVRRLRLRDWVIALVLAGWFFLYLFQGAVYYHLQVCLIIVLLGVRRGHPIGSFVAVVAASFWAGMSRLN